MSPSEVTMLLGLQAGLAFLLLLVLGAGASLIALDLIGRVRRWASRSTS